MSTTVYTSELRYDYHRIYSSSRWKATRLRYKKILYSVKILAQFWSVYSNWLGISKFCEQFQGFLFKLAFTASAMSSHNWKTGVRRDSTSLSLIFRDIFTIFGKINCTKPCWLKILNSLNLLIQLTIAAFNNIMH